MARHAGRSKGCAICRQKRIKCDEKAPQCSQCLSSELKCTGPLVGSIFIDQSSETAKRQKRSRLTKPKNKATNKIKACSSDSLLKKGNNNALFRTSMQSTTKLSVGNLEFPQGDKSTSPKNSSRQVEIIFSQPSPIPALKEYLLGNFIDSLTKTPGSPVLKKWLSYVPDLMSHGASLTLQFAAYAASMVLFGSVIKNCAVRQEGYRWYAMGLQRQKSQLVIFSQAPNLEDISDAKICGTLFLSFFEMTCGTTSTAWKHHIFASARLIELRGVETFQDNLPHELLRAVRLSMVYLTTEIRQPTFLSSHNWLTVPFAKNKKTRFDELVDILLSIPTLLAMADNTVEGGKMLDGICNLRLGTSLESYSVALDEWAFGYELKQHGRDTAPCNHPKVSTKVNDPFRIETISLYDSSCILIAAARKSLAATTQKTLLNRQISQHSESILAAVESIERENIWYNAGGPFRLIHPLKVVATSSPCDGQVASAKSILNRWSVQYGMEGICKIEGR